jgi:hypothetical protein
VNAPEDPIGGCVYCVCGGVTVQHTCNFCACCFSPRYIDIMVFGKGHIYSDPTCYDIYDCKTPYDPEGLVGAFNAVLLTYLGLLVGRVLVGGLMLIYPFLFSLFNFSFCFRFIITP